MGMDYARLSVVLTGAIHALYSTIQEMQLKQIQQEQVNEQIKMQLEQIQRKLEHITQ